jgi:O-antigen ligase
MSWNLDRTRALVRGNGMVYCYAVFIAGYFMLPMVSGHRRLYYLLVIPPVLMLWRELLARYKGNTLMYLALAFMGYMTSSLLWTPGFSQTEALWSLWFSFALVTFFAITGFLWVEKPELMDKLLHGGLYVAAAAGLVSILAWYLQNPFPSSRLELLGVMSQTNNAACVFGLFTVLASYYLITTPGRQGKITYLLLTSMIFSVVLLTQSRTALAAVIVGMLALVGYRALGVIAIAIALNWALMAANSLLWTDRVATFSFRPGIWQQVLSDMQGHWWFGRGSLANPEVAAYEQVFNNAHNGYLATLRDGGLVGLSLLVAVLCLAGFWALQLYRQRGERIYLALLLYAMTCIAMDFDRLLVHPNELWLFFWAPLALIMATYATKQETIGHIRYAMTSK